MGDPDQSFITNNNWINNNGFQKRMTQTMNKQTLIDRYRLDEIVGEGSYSIVFRGYDLQDNKKVAIKELKSQGFTKEEADEAHRLFFNEINILKNIRHENIPQVFDFFICQGRNYMVMEWVEGETLEDVLEREGKISEKIALKYMKQIADTLTYLQRSTKQIIYRDIKPANIMVDSTGNLKIVDFGIARYYSPEKKKDTHILGTPGYAPPEAYRGFQTDYSADIYSLGVTFYHLATGEEPLQFKFQFPNPKKFTPQLSDFFAELLTDCLKDRKQRIQNAVELQRRLRKVYREIYLSSVISQKKDNKEREDSLISVIISYIVISLVFSPLFLGIYVITIYFAIDPVISFVISSVVYLTLISYVIKEGKPISKQEEIKSYTIEDIAADDSYCNSTFFNSVVPVFDPEFYDEVNACREKNAQSKTSTFKEPASGNSKVTSTDTKKTVTTAPEKIHNNYNFEESNTDEEIDGFFLPFNREDMNSQLKNDDTMLLKGKNIDYPQRLELIPLCYMLLIPIAGFVYRIFDSNIGPLAVRWSMIISSVIFIVIILFQGIIFKKLFESYKLKLKYQGKDREKVTLMKKEKLQREFNFYLGLYGAIIASFIFLGKMYENSFAGFGFYLFIIYVFMMRYFFEKQ